MKKSLLFLGLSGTVVFALAFYTIPKFSEFINTQLAAVIGIDIQDVRQWQLQGGLNRDLAMGSEGTDVQLLQKGLNKILPNFPTANITSHFGPKTSRAIIEFQNIQGLTANGRLDTDTRLALNDVYFKELCPEGHGGGSSPMRI